MDLSVKSLFIADSLLRKFYHRFAANRKTDPTGYETLKKVLNTSDMDKFKKNWEAYVLKLRYP